MTTLYVAGPMSGLPEHNHPAFYAAQAELEAAGYRVLNPADNSGDATGTWEFYVRAGLRQLLEADGVAVLPGWDRSPGARLEAYVASRIEMPVHSAKVWLFMALEEAA